MEKKSYIVMFEFVDEPHVPCGFGRPNTFSPIEDVDANLRAFIESVGKFNGGTARKISIAQIKDGVKPDY